MRNRAVKSIALAVASWWSCASHWPRTFRLQRKSPRVTTDRSRQGARSCRRRNAPVHALQSALREVSGRFRRFRQTHLCWRRTDPLQVGIRIITQISQRLFTGAAEGFALFPQFPLPPPDPGRRNKSDRLSAICCLTFGVRPRKGGHRRRADGRPRASDRLCQRAADAPVCVAG